MVPGHILACFLLLITMAWEWVSYKEKAVYFGSWFWGSKVKGSYW